MMKGSSECTALKNPGRLFFCIALSLVFALQITETALGESYNASGVVNRAIAVDPTGRSEGFSAVLYDNRNGLPTSEANTIAETSEGLQKPARR